MSPDHDAISSQSAGVCERRREQKLKLLALAKSLTQTASLRSLTLASGSSVRPQLLHLTQQMLQVFLCAEGLRVKTDYGFTKI